MKIHENLKNEGKTRKNYKPRGGYDTIYPALLGPFIFMPNCSVGPSECEKKFSLKMVWACENAWFPWQPKDLEIQSYLDFYLS